MMSAWAICAMVAATVAVACPNEKTAKKDTPCSKSAKTVAEKSPCSAHSETTAVTVSTDGRSEEGKPCCADKKAKEAKTVSADAGKPCCADKAKKAKTVADKKGGCGAGCGAGCPCHKGAELTSAKSDTPCSKSAKGDAPCSKSAKQTADAGCPIQKKIDAVLTSLPAMKYRVGDKTLGCPKSAAAMAEKEHTKVEYVVGDETIDCEVEATAKLTKLLEEELTNMASVQYVVGDHCGQCPMTAKTLAKKSGATIKYRVAGVDFDKKEDAEKVAKLVAEAVSAEHMNYKVDGKTYGCSKTAGEKCKKTGAKLTYVVGDEETCCEKTAKLKFTEAKIRKAVETAASAAMSL
jgi:hypothetical protein